MKTFTGTFTRKTINLEVEPSDSFKNGISKRNSSRPADIDLYKEAEQLDDERVLSDYNIQKEKESSVLSLEITWRNEDLHQDTHGERNHPRS